MTEGRLCAKSDKSDKVAVLAVLALSEIPDSWRLVCQLLCQKVTKVVSYAAFCSLPQPGITVFYAAFAAFCPPAGDSGLPEPGLPECQKVT